MRKIHLDIDRLKVESFRTTDDERAARGTVHGQDSQRGRQGTVQAASDFTRESCDNCSGLRPCELSYATDMQVVCPCQDPGETGIVC